MSIGGLVLSVCSDYGYFEDWDPQEEVLIKMWEKGFLLDLVPKKTIKYHDVKSRQARWLMWRDDKLEAMGTNILDKDTGLDNATRSKMVGIAQVLCRSLYKVFDIKDKIPEEVRSEVVSAFSSRSAKDAIQVLLASTSQSTRESAGVFQWVLKAQQNKRVPCG